MRRFIPVSTALALAAAVLTAPSGASAASAPAAPAAEKGTRPTAYAMKAGGFGTKIRGGEIPAASGSTAFRSIGCTNLAGIRRSNYVAEVEVPGLGKVSGVRTSLRTMGGKTSTSVVSRHRIARIILAESSFGRLALEGVTSLAKATATPSGFSTQTETNVASLVFRPTDGEPQELKLPTPGRPIEIPGLLRIAVGNHVDRKTGDSAKAIADTIRINIIPTKSRVVVGHTAATIFKGIKSGLFAGSANTSSATALEGIAKTGRTQLVQMPCQGTKGVVRSNDAAGLNLPGALDVGAVRARQMGKQDRKRATGFEEASVASLDLGDGALKIDAIIGRVDVDRKKGEKAEVSFAGSRLGGITVDGEAYSVPELDGLEIPGLVRVDTLIKEKLKNGGRMTALRLTLLDGTGAVVNLGEANLRIFPSKR